MNYKFEFVFGFVNNDLSPTSFLGLVLVWICFSVDTPYVKFMI